ncbi:MAG: ferredoxin [Desulfomicrobium escambiense]|nr:ferredoxin [Desulfomicrobium escambiense]
MVIPVVDYDECIGRGLAPNSAPEVFEMRDDEKAYVIGADKCNTCDCEEAASACPSEAIKFE